MADAIRLLIDARKIVVNRPSAEVGLALLEAGGDFTDSLIAYEGERLGSETFISFDKQAVKLLAKSGQATCLL